MSKLSSTPSSLIVQTDQLDQQALGSISFDRDDLLSSSQTLSTVEVQIQEAPYYSKSSSTPIHSDDLQLCNKCDEPENHAMIVADNSRPAKPLLQKNVDNIFRCDPTHARNERSSTSCGSSPSRRWISANDSNKLDVTITVISLDGIVARRYEPMSKISTQRKKNYDTIDTATVVASFSQTLSGREFLTHLPSDPFEVETSVIPTKTVAQHLIQWPGLDNEEAEDDKNIELSTYRCSRDFHLERHDDVKYSSTKRFIPQTCPISVSISRQGKLISLGIANLIITGEERGVSSVAIPIKIAYRKSKVKKIPVKKFRKGSKSVPMTRVKGDNFQFGLKCDAMLRVLVCATDVCDSNQKGQKVLHMPSLPASATYNEQSDFDYEYESVEDYDDDNADKTRGTYSDVVSRESIQLEQKMQTIKSHIKSLYLQPTSVKTSGIIELKAARHERDDDPRDDEVLAQVSIVRKAEVSKSLKPNKSNRDLDNDSDSSQHGDYEQAGIMGEENDEQDIDGDVLRLEEAIKEVEERVNDFDIVSRASTLDQKPLTSSLTRECVEILESFTTETLDIISSSMQSQHLSPLIKDEKAIEGTMHSIELKRAGHARYDEDLAQGTLGGKTDANNSLEPKNKELEETITQLIQQNKELVESLASISAEKNKLEFSLTEEKKELNRIQEELSKREQQYEDKLARCQADFASGGDGFLVYQGTTTAASSSTTTTPVTSHTLAGNQDRDTIPVRRSLSSKPKQNVDRSLSHAAKERMLRYKKTSDVCQKDDEFAKSRKQIEELQQHFIKNQGDESSKSDVSLASSILNDIQAGMMIVHTITLKDGPSRPKTPIKHNPIVADLLSKVCTSLNFDIAELWLAKGLSYHLVHSHVRRADLNESMWKHLQDLYYGEGSNERTHRLSLSMCKWSKKTRNTVWITEHQTPQSAQALKYSISGVQLAVAVPVRHGGIHATILYFSMTSTIMEPFAPGAEDYLTRNSEMIVREYACWDDSVHTFPLKGLPQEH